MVLLASVLGVSLIACGSREQPVQLRFMLDDAASVHRLQFYVYDVRLVDEAGGAHPLTLAARPPWQTDRVALVEIAPATRDVVEGEAPVARYTGVQFAVGVPFDLNHANPLTAVAPLDRAEMFWTWQSGYKFLRLDLTAGEHEAAFHLGSTGCSSASALRPPQQPCAQPNVMQVELRGFDPTTQPIRVRASDIVAALEAAEQRACTGDYAQPACATAYAMTGLGAKTGLCGANAATSCRQRLFEGAAPERSASRER